MERVASCACERLKVTVEGDPLLVLACHCDFCLRRSGGAYPVIAYFSKDRVVEISGTSSVFDGKEQNGEGGPLGLRNLFNFCPTCGSTVFWTFEDIPGDPFPKAFQDMLPDAMAISVGSFADPDFPPPSLHVFEELRPHWLQIHQA